MAEKFVIQGGKRLSGEIEVRGSKNAAGPILAACLLTDKECVIDNLPLIEDIFNILEVFKSIGVGIENISERKIKIKAEKLELDKMDFEKVSRTRISVLLFGALISRAKNFVMSAPGGDRIGLRPIYVHLDAFEKLGAKIERNDGFYTVDCANLKGTEIVLDEFSVTATENIMLAAVFAEGKTVIKGAACEPHVEDLGKMLSSMGAKIKGAGTHTIEVEGVKNLNGAEHTIISDYLEAGTFIVIGASVPGSSIRVKNVPMENLDLFFKKIDELGINFKKEGDDVIVSYTDKLNALRIQALPYPGFPTDLLPVVIPLLTRAKGKSLIHDPLYPGRFNYVNELRKMGADIEIVDPHRAFVFGPSELSGLTIESWDIRAGASLIIAGLMAEGKTTIQNIYQIDRGYEKIEERLSKIGADIKRTN